MAYLALISEARDLAVDNASSVEEERDDDAADDDNDDDEDDEDDGDLLDCNCLAMPKKSLPPGLRI